MNVLIPKPAPLWEVFWRLTIVSEAEWVRRKDWYLERYVNCLCICWSECTRKLSRIKFWDTKSCWCLHREVAKEVNTTHWMSKTDEYNIRHKLKDRCYKTNSADYHRYWWRWIKVCDRRLESFENFYEDMWDRPKWLSIDRIDNDWDYTPDNCRRSTKKEQANNRRSNRSYKWKNLWEWATLLWVNSSSLSERIDKYWWSKAVTYKKILPQTYKWKTFSERSSYLSVPCSTMNSYKRYHDLSFNETIEHYINKNNLVVA